MATLQPAECTRALRNCGQPRDQRSQMLAAARGRTHRTAVPHGQELGGRVVEEVEEGCSLLANPMCIRKLFNKPLAFYTPSHCLL